MSFDFDQIFDRRSARSLKWTEYPDDVIPAWVADMDFQSPAPIVESLRQRAEHGIFGYEWPRRDLAELICERLFRMYKWEVAPEEIVFLPGIVCGLNVACRTASDVGNCVISFTPVYPPFLLAPGNQNMRLRTVELSHTKKESLLHYEIDFDRFEQEVTSTQASLFLLCQPHNPVGKEFSVSEVFRLAEICLKNNVIICSDEIHCDLLFSGVTHTPTAALSPDIAQACITLMSPSKTFNISGLGASYAIIQNPQLRKKFKHAAAGIVPELNIFAITACRAAYGDCDDWLAAVLAYMEENRDTLARYMKANLPGISITIPDATYLAWFDCHDSGIDGNPAEFFLKQAKVALNDGTIFGSGGEGFVRFNFACPRSLMMDALDRMAYALSGAALSS